MAKRKKKTSSLKFNIKYEIYGILLIIFSVITLAGQGQGSIPGIGSVGRALSSICLFIAGNVYYMIPVIFIYIGLYVMIKRTWPMTWSYRKTGILLGMFSILITYHIHLFSSLQPMDDLTANQIFTQSFAYMKDLTLTQGETIVNENLGGGMAGALMYGALYFFFGYMGSVILVIAMFLIAFICITGVSYVDLGSKVNYQLQSFTKQVQIRLREMYILLKRKSQLHQRNIESMNDLVDEEKYHDHKKRASLNEAPDEVIFQADPMENQGPVYKDFQDEVTTHVELSSLTLDAEIDPEEVLIKPKVSLNGELMKEESPILIEKKQKPTVPYQLPPFHLLTKPEAGKAGANSDYKANARKLETTLESFGVKTKVLQVVRGPSVTRYEIQPDVGVKVSRIVSLTDDIALALAAKDIRMEAPIPGKSAIGIEVPNSEVSIVTLREVMESSAFMESESKLSITFGRDISGQPIVGNLAKMPHLLVAGATGSGKSVCVNGIIVSILYKAKPSEVKFLMIDPKKVELNVYNGIPHLLAPVVTDPRRASLALKKVVSEMEKRYELFSNTGARNIEGYNELISENKEMEQLPFIVVIVDELADLMMVAAKDVEEAICRLAQMARAAGIHLIIATQRPSVDVITGLIKANIPSRIAFGVSSQVDSRTILDTVGAEKLLGRGDMLFLPVGASKSIRVQGAFLSDHEVEKVVTFVKNQEQAQYQKDLVPEINEDVADETEDHTQDELYDQAVQIILEAKQASVSLLQRRMRIGYTRAARLIDSMEANGVVGPYEGSKPREVLITMEHFHQNRA